MYTIIYQVLSKILFFFYSEAFTEDDKEHPILIIFTKRIGVKCVLKSGRHIKRVRSTIRIDLNDNIQNLKKNMEKTTRNLINRGLKNENLNTTIKYLGVHDIIDYIKLHNENASIKLSFRSKLRLYYLCKKNKILISRVNFKNGPPLFCHLIIVSESSSMLLYSFENFQAVSNLSDRSVRQSANRLLHYFDLQYLCSKELNYFDWAGVYQIDDGSKLYRIGKFKSSFGGEHCLIHDEVKFKIPFFRSILT
jgi:hypothetical protein